MNAIGAANAGAIAKPGAAIGTTGPRTQSQRVGSQTTASQTTASQTAGSQTAESQTTESQTARLQTAESQKTGPQKTGPQTAGLQTTESKTAGLQPTEPQTTRLQTTVSQAAGLQTTESPAARMIDVMLCDDHTIVLAGLERLVSTFPGIRVVATVEGGAGAVEAVLAHRPHIVLMDLQMAMVDGIEATRQIMAAAPSTCVVVLTSFSDRHRIQSALAAGAIGYQLKDATPSELESAIRAAARGEAPLAPKVAMTLVRAEASPEPVLSPRELETLELVAKGMPNKQIGRKLAITEATVKAHLTSIFRRIGVQNRTQAARWFERSQGEP